MKKLKTALLLIVIALAICVPSVYAGTANTDSMKIVADVAEDGSMEVNETIVWNIDGDLNGVYRDILIGNSDNTNSSASDIKIYSVMVDEQYFNYSSETGSNGDMGIYNVDAITNGVKVKVFVPSSDETRTVTICYKLSDVVTKYTDVAEVYWNFIGKGWDNGIDNVFIKINLPKESNLLKIYGHGPLNGNSKILDQKTVELTVDGLRSKEAVDARVLFDTSLVPNATKSVNKVALDEIVKDETVLANQANAKRKVAENSLYVTLAVCVFAIILPIYTYITYKKKLPKATFDGEYYRELPEDYGVTVMKKVLYPVDGPDSNDMLGTLLDLVRKKYVGIEPLIKEGKKKPYDYNLKLLNTDTSELTEVEKYFISHLIFKDCNEISLKEIKKRNGRSTSSQEESYKEFTKWGEKITKFAKEKDVLKEKNDKMAKYIFRCVASMLLAIIVIICGIALQYEDIIGYGMVTLFITIFTAVVVILNIVSLNSRTQKGIEHEAMWRAFKKFLMDFSKLDEHGYDSIVLWEHYLVYATGLGVADKVIKQLQITIPDIDQNNMMTNYMVYSLLSDGNSFDSFADSFTSASSAAFSNPSSGSGSGGGFSGGGGGRRRRRRRRWLLNLKTGKENNMSSFIMHLCVSEKVRKTLNLGDKFLCGSVLPDLLKLVGEPREKTHYTEKITNNGMVKNLPNIELFKQDYTYSQDEEIRLGYMAHLIEDKIWFDEYIPKYQKQGKLNDENTGFCENLYKDYTRLNLYIPETYGLDVPYTKEIIHNVLKNSEYDRIFKDCIAVNEKENETQNIYILKQDIEEYIDKAYCKVIEEIKKVTEG